MKKCERCGKKLDYTYFEERDDRLTDLYINGLSVDLCKDCDKELVKWLCFSREKLKKDYMITTKDEA